MGGKSSSSSTQSTNQSSIEAGIVNAPIASGDLTINNAIPTELKDLVTGLLDLAKTGVQSGVDSANAATQIVRQRVESAEQPNTSNALKIAPWALLATASIAVIMWATKGR